MKIIFSLDAQKALLKSNKRVLILSKLRQLAANPNELGNNVTKLKGRDEMRLRVQDWRVIFLLSDNVIMIRDIAPRSSVYED